MFEARKVYTSTIWWGILFSQVIPTFGAYLGFAGNWIPYTIGFAVTAVGVSLYLFEKRTVSDQIMRCSFFLYWIVAVGHTVALMLFFSELSNPEEYADLFRWFTIPIFILAGLVYARKNDSPLKGGYILGLTLILFTFLLFADFVANGDWSNIQKIYKTRTMGFGRFPGNWNYPYNMSIALFFYILVLGLGWQQAKSWTASFLSALGVTMCTLLIFVGQSRGSLAALFGTVALFILYRTILLNVAEQFRFRSRVILPIGFIVGGSALALSVSSISFYDVVQQFGKRYLQFADFASVLGSSERGEEVVQVNKYIYEYPASLLIGFGPMRSVDFWVQSLFLYVLRYGIMGLILYVFLIPSVTIAKAYSEACSLTQRRIVIGYTAWIAFILLNSISHDMFSHFRFVPLFYFVTGFVLGIRHRDDI